MYRCVLFIGCSAFYLSILPNPKTQIWYKCEAMGIHSIEAATKCLAASLGMPEENFVSNTSLRRTAMNRLVTAGIRKDIIQKKTGRVSDSADGSYISGELYEKEMTAALYNPSSILVRGVPNSRGGVAIGEIGSAGVGDRAPDRPSCAENVALSGVMTGGIATSGIGNNDVGKSEVVSGGIATAASGDLAVNLSPDLTLCPGNVGVSNQIFKFHYQCQDKVINFELPM